MSLACLGGLDDGFGDTLSPEFEVATELSTMRVIERSAGDLALLDWGFSVFDQLEGIG